MRVVGIDGWRGGWVAITLRDGRFVDARVSASLGDLVDGDVVGVDIPVGLVDAGIREADAAARAFLGPRASTVFPTAPRPAVFADTWAVALATCRRLTGQGLSKQAFHLHPRVREADAWIGRVHEVHPEVSFALLTGAQLPPKKTWAGQARRRAALREVGLDLPDAIGPAGVVPPDDVLDAAVVAWSAARVATGTARSFPDRVTQLDRGFPIRIRG